MKQIAITYRPLKRLKFTRVAKGTHPETWKEVTPVQLIAIACLYKQSINEVDFIHQITGLKKRIIRKLDNYQRFKIMQLVDFVNTPEPYNRFIIEKIKTNKALCLAPKPKLKGMPFGQFIFADSYFGNYQDTSEPEELNNFISALYLPAGKPFIEDFIGQLSPEMAKLSPVTREAIFINYLLVKEWLAVVYPLVFAKPDPDAPPRKHDPMAWVKTFENLVGDDLPNKDKYEQLPVHDVFRYMTRKIKENAKRKQ